VHLDTDALNETGGTAIAALAGSSKHGRCRLFHTRRPRGDQVALAERMMLIVRAALVWQHAFGAVTPSAALAFQRIMGPCRALCRSGGFSSLCVVVDQR
jgi:uncharacterized protein with beta-barrel porin domain